MKENVGRIDQIGRFVVGPALAVFGVAKLGAARDIAWPGLAAAIVGTLITESAITRVCPVNRLLGLDTRTQRERDRDLESLLQLHERNVRGVAPRFESEREPVIPRAPS